MLDNMKIELGKYYHFDELRKKWEENYPEAEPLTVEFLEENLSPEIKLYEVEGNYVSFHLKSLGDISQITEGTFTVERCKIDFKNPKVFSARVNVCGIDQGSNSDGIVLFQDSDKNFFVELEDGKYQRELVNIKDLFHGIHEEKRAQGYIYHFPARGVVLRQNTLSLNRASHNADCRPNFGRMDFSQNSVYQLVTAKDTYRPINTDPPQGLRLTVFDKPYLSVENLSRRIYGNSNCTFVYSSPFMHSEEYHKKYRKLLNLAFRFPDQQKVFAYEKTEAIGYGTIALLGNSTDKIAANYDQYTENFAKNFKRLFHEDLNLTALRRNRIYFEIFHSDVGSETRDATMQSFTIDPPKKHERECNIRPCWMGYEGQKYTGGRYQNILFKDVLMANLAMALLGFQFGKSGNEDKKQKATVPMVEESYREGKQAFQEISQELLGMQKEESELVKFAAYCDLLRIPIRADILKNIQLENEYGRSAEITELLELTEKILSSPLNHPVEEEITRLNSERLLKYFRLDQKPVGNPNEYCRHPSLIHNIPIGPMDVPRKMALLFAKIDNMKFTMGDGSKIRFRECILHLAELIKIKWAKELEQNYTESLPNHGIEQSSFQYQPGIMVSLSAKEDKEMIRHYSDPDFYSRIASFISGLCENEISEITKINLFRMAQIFLPVICAEESQNFALLQKRRESFYFAPSQELDPIDPKIERLSKRTKLSLLQARQIFEQFPKTKEKYCVDSFMVPLSETLAEILLNMISLVREFRSHFPDVNKSWESFTSLYKKQPRSQSLQEWQMYCKEKDAPLPISLTSAGAETCEIELKKAADEIKKHKIAAPVGLVLKNFKIASKVIDEAAKTRTRMPLLIKEFMECNKKIFRTEDWSLIVNGMAYYLAMSGENFHPAIDSLCQIFQQSLASQSQSTEEAGAFYKNFASFWQPDPVKSSTQPPSNEDVAKTLIQVYNGWLQRAESLLQEIRDCERIQGSSLANYHINEDLYGQYSTLQGEVKPHVNSFVFYVFSGQGTHVLYKFMAKHINNAILLKTVDKDGKIGLAKGYRSQVHFLDIDQLMSVVFGGMEVLSPSQDIYEIARKSLSRKLIAPLGLAILGSYRCSADNKVSFSPSAEVELDQYDLIATSSVGPEMENQVEYPFTGELVSHIEDQRPVMSMKLEKGLLAPKDRIYFVPETTLKPAYFQISKTGGNVNVWKREVARHHHGAGWQPQSYYYLGCFEFPEFEKEMELYLLPFVSKSHRKREDRVAILFKNKRENILYAQPNLEHKLPAKILKLWDKDHDSAQDEQAYPAEFFDGKVFILKDLWPKQQLIASIAGQNHFSRFLSLAEISGS
ncbi:MAG: hypothetical protein HUU50_15585 [Candidatus Brocadiae bacterium]|nr:hypothetical protein [Candidatus Brocadiia bacterium]